MEEFSEFHTHDHSHGYTNGFEDVDQQPYEAYITSRVKYDLLTKQVTIVEKAISELETTLASSDALYERYQSALQAIPIREQKVKRCEEELTQVFQEEELFRQQTEELRPRMLPVVGWLFVLAGIVFMIADFFISQTIVANALSMDKGLESSLFALGISFISVLLKPAYDVVRSKAKLRRICLWMIAGITLITVGFMGLFRYEAFKDEQLRTRSDARKNTIRQLLDDSSPEDQIKLNKEMEGLTEQVNKSNLALTTSISSKSFFLLVGILFAIAGAICLGEGLYVFAKHRRWKSRMPYYPLYFSSFKDYRISKQQNLSEEQNRLVADRVQLETTQKQLKELEPLGVKLKEQKQLLGILEQERLQVDIDNRIAYYQDGYDRGKTYRESDAGREEKKTQRSNSANHAPRQQRSAYKILADSIMSNFAKSSNYNQNYELENN